MPNPAQNDEDMEVRENYGHVTQLGALYPYTVDPYMV